MKKFLLILTVLFLLCGCVSPHRIVGEEYVVTRVEVWNYEAYGTKYFVKAKCVNPNSVYLTVDGNYVNYYTNTFYSVGDTIKITNNSRTCTKYSK